MNLDNQTVLSKTFLIIGTIATGLATGVGVALMIQKRREKAVGGKLMRVNYRFTKDFDD